MIHQSLVLEFISAEAHPWMDEMVTENKKAADGVQVDQVSALQHEEEEAYGENDIEPKEG